MAAPERLDWQPDPGADPSSLVYTFGGAEAVVSVRAPAVISTWTRDAFNGAVTSVDDKPSVVITNPHYLNPQTGPFFVEGAEPGDTLAVHFVSIEPRDTWGASSTVPFFGSLTATPSTAMLHGALEERTWIFGIDKAAGTVRYEARDSSFSVEMPLDPMHGTVGVAPARFEVRHALTPGAWGGNMDTPEMRAGVTCYLGVNVEGALFSLGDGHARQGEGETCGVAVEASMETVFILELLKGVTTPWPRLETDTHLMSTGSARPLEDAFRISHVDIIRWIAGELELSELDAYQLVSQTAESPVANVVDIDYTMVAKVAKRYLPGATPYGGAHGRLRAMAAGLV
jgi:acetamidase/formamidase